MFISGKLKLFFLLFTVIFSFSEKLKAQSFYKEKEPKTIFYQIGVGAGTFFAAPRPSYDSIVNEKMPVLSVGLGKKLSDHFTIKSQLSFQPISSKEAALKEEGVYELDPIFQGYSYGFDVTPTFNLVPSFHHMSRPIVDIHGGLGIGYLLTYRTETFTYQEKKYEFSFFESSFYFPVRVSTVIRLGILSDLEIEGALFYTFLNDSRSDGGFKKDSDHLGQLNLIYRRYFR